MEFVFVVVVTAIPLQFFTWLHTEDKFKVVLLPSDKAITPMEVFRYPKMFDFET